MLAHAAFRMGEVAAENALKGNHAVAKLNLTPAAIYTLPEVAAVGLTEEQAREKMMSKSVNSTLRRTVVPLHQMRLKDL